MSAARGAWVESHGAVPARERVARTVRALARSRWTQIGVDRVAGALLAGLALATPAVLAARLGVVPLSPWAVALAILVVALIAGVALAVRARPDPLEVAIRADLALNMKQRMSTAWEAMADGDDPALADALAAQAVRARLPSRSAGVFPLRLGACARLIPVAAALLALVATVDLGRVATRAWGEPDPDVVGEGARLLEYAQRLEGRARSQSLASALEAAQRLQDLGAQMRSGALSREQSLARLREQSGRLDEERRAALESGPQRDVGPVQTETVDGPSPREGGGRGAGAGERLRAGSLTPEQAQSLGAGGGMARVQGELRDAGGDAGDDLQPGDGRARASALERDARRDGARAEARALDEAREQVARARESLGDPSAPGAGGRESTPPPTAGGGGADSRGTEYAAGAQTPDGEDAPGDLGGGSATRGSTPADPRAPEPAPDYRATGPLLQPASRPSGSGAVFLSEARVLPRAAPVETPLQAVDRRYAAQVEHVLSREQYPARDKAFVRRYFLSLGDGEGGGAAAALPERGLPAGTSLEDVRPQDLRRDDTDEVPRR